MTVASFRATRSPRSVHHLAGRNRNALTAPDAQRYRRASAPPVTDEADLAAGEPGWVPRFATITSTCHVLRPSVTNLVTAERTTSQFDDQMRRSLGISSRTDIRTLGTNHPQQPRFESLVRWRSGGDCRTSLTGRRPLVPLWRHVARWALSLVVFVALVLINASYWEPPEPGDPRLDSDDGHSEQVLGRVTVGAPVAVCQSDIQRPRPLPSIRDGPRSALA